MAEYEHIGGHGDVLVDGDAYFCPFHQQWEQFPIDSHIPDEVKNNLYYRCFSEPVKV